jgi:hypothetical protein
VNKVRLNKLFSVFIQIHTNDYDLTSDPLSFIRFLLDACYTKCNKTCFCSLPV